MYLSAPINRQYSPTIHISKGQAVVEFAVRPEYFHAAKAVHGAIYFKALDDAAFFAVSSLVEQYFVLTASLEVQFKQPITGGVIHSEGSVRSGDGRRFVGEAVITVDGVEVASGSGTFVRSHIRLADTDGYRGELPAEEGAA